MPYAHSEPGYLRQALEIGDGDVEFTGTGLITADGSAGTVAPDNTTVTVKRLVTTAFGICKVFDINI